MFINGAVVLSLPELQRIAAKEGRVTAFQVYLQPDADPAAVIERVESAHPNLVAIGDAAQYGKVDQGLEMIDGTVWVISLLALIVGSIIVANTMWMSVLERTREIGVLRAVGWSRQRIVTMILIEAAGVGLIACVVGCAAAGAALARLAAGMQVAKPLHGTGVRPHSLPASTGRGHRPQRARRVHAGMAGSTHFTGGGAAL